MEVLEIVQSAAFKSGLVPSFNPDELPGDIIEAGRNVLAQEIIPSLNCDRTLDITVTSRTYAVDNGMIVLKPLSQPIENNKLLGYSRYTLDELYNDFTKFEAEVRRLDPSFIVNNVWPTDDLGRPISAMLWSSDIHIIRGCKTADDTEYMIPQSDINIDFPPMRVDAIMDEGSRIKYEYLYREEFEQVIRAASPLVYTVEEYEDKLVVLINGTSDLKRLVLPVPLQIINIEYDHAGTIIAPPKFKRYLIDALAVSLAIIYGLSTVDAMRQQAEQSYQLLKKNKTQPMHRANVSEEINNVLHDGRRGRKLYAGF